MNIHVFSGWTDERVKQLCELHAANLPFSEIADAIGMTRNACIGKAQRIGLPARTVELTVEERFARSQAKLAALRAKRAIQREQRRERARGNIPPKLYRPRIEHDLREKALHLEFDELESRHCRFPYGDGPFTFCGHPKLANTSYCEAHVAFCFEVTA